jgi:hypothetical protein
MVAAREAATIADPDGRLPAPVTNCLLGIPLEVRKHRRDPKTRLAPPELMRVHPSARRPFSRDFVFERTAKDATM